LTLSIVVPLHNEEEVVQELIARLAGVLELVDCGAEIILVADGSTDKTWERVQSAAADDDRVRAIRLSRNFGHQAALTAGLEASQGDSVITMDGDLQHPPELIPQLLEKGREGFDVVYAVRSSTDAEGFGKKRMASAFYWLLNKLSPLDLPPGAADFRYMSRRVVDALAAMPERQRFLRGLTRWVGYDQTVVSYDRAPRRAGTTKYTRKRMITFAWDAITSFSATPLRVASWVGFLTTMLGWLYLLYVLAIGVFTRRVVPGWTSAVAAVLILGGVQLLCLGIFGQYLGRMFDEVKRRPLYLVREEIGATRLASAERGAIAVSVENARTVRGS
jgi:polyisoprenyl-phosphate glycosyltransferase